SARSQLSARNFLLGAGLVRGLSARIRPRALYLWSLRVNFCSEPTSCDFLLGADLVPCAPWTLCSDSLLGASFEALPVMSLAELLSLSQSMVYDTASIHHF